MKSEWYFFPLCGLDFTIIIKRKNHYKQSAQGIYVLPVAPVHKNRSEKWENIAETEWVLASQNEIEERGGHLLQMLQEDKHQGVEKAISRQEQTTITGASIHWGCKL